MPTPERTLEERVEVGYRWAAERVWAASSEGIGKEDWVWEFVAPFDRAFLEAMQRWEASGTDRDRRAAVKAADELVARWREAGQEWWRRRCGVAEPAPAPVADPLAPAMALLRRATS